MKNCVPSFICLQYVDDFTIHRYRKEKDIKSCADTRTNQFSNRLTWSSNNNLAFNATKAKAMLFTTNQIIATNFYLTSQNIWSNNSRNYKMQQLVSFWTNSLIQSNLWWECSQPLGIMGPYIYDVHTEVGWGSLEICHVFADSIVFKQ